ncbi:MAG: hypothetical protein JNM19_17820 [Chitinophagaceae bacterium]|nr:hypothetical protein [Chitinophagaceae bacterium]
MRKIAFSLLCALVLNNTPHAQDSKPSIAVLPFISAVSNTSQSNYTSIVQDMVTQQLVKGNRFNILDRSKFQKVLDELNVQKQEEFLNSKIVEQGRLEGAAYLVTGVINQMSVTEERYQEYNSVTKMYELKNRHNVEIKFSFQVIDVARGIAVHQENLYAKNTPNHDNKQADALENAQCLLRKQVKMSVAKIFPEEIQLVSVEKEDKKGLPDMVLISAGTNYFDEDYKKGNECEKGLMDKINIFKKKESVKLKVYEEETITVGDKIMKREKLIGWLKLDKVEGEFSICEVTEGAEIIKDKLASKKTLLVRII